MLWDDEKDSKDSQRLKNLLVFKFWGTNEERDEVFNSPLFWALLGIVIVGLLVLAIIVK